MSISDDPTRMEEPDEPEGGSLRPGQTFGQYKVIGLLGRGGMGEVYRVRHEVLEREYALKLIHPEVLESRDALQRFQDEARVMAKLDHPNIVKVDDFGTTEGRHWLRMELVAGGDENDEGRMANSAPLRSSSFEGSPSAGADSERESADQASFFGASFGEYVQAHDGRLPESHVREILRQILEGLGYAHGKGLVHRDIKPANILLARGARNDEGRMADGGGNASVRMPQVKIADFGLVRVAGEDWLRSQVEKSVAQSMSISEQATRVLDSGSGQAGTSTRALLGTYAYMSPEQKRGEDVDARSDLYAVGLMAFQMLTGEESLGLKAPSRINPEINPAWDEWILNATESKREERFASAEEMLSALNELPVGVPPLGGPSFISRGSKGKRPPKGGTPTRETTPKRRRPLLTTLSILFILSILGIGTWQAYEWWEREQARTAEQLATEREAAQLEAEQQERLTAGRAEFERLLGTGNLEEAGGVLASLEEDGFPVFVPIRTDDEIEWERLRRKVAQIDDYLKNVKPLLDLPFLAEQEEIAVLEQQRIDARATIDQLSKSYRHRHPLMIEAQEYLHETENQLIEAVGQAVAKIRQEEKSVRKKIEIRRLSADKQGESLGSTTPETLDEGYTDAIPTGG